MKTVDQNVQLSQPDAFDVEYKEIFTFWGSTDQIIKFVNKATPSLMIKYASKYVLSKDGVNVILPENYVDLDNNFDKDSIIGTEVKVVFVKSEQDEKGRTRIIVSRKQVQYNEERKAKEEEFASINVDDILTGTVERITDFGAFVKLNHIDGLIHLNDVSHYRIKSVSEMLEIGQEVTCKVIKKTETKIQ